MFSTLRSDLFKHYGHGGKGPSTLRQLPGGDAEAVRRVTASASSTAAVRELLVAADDHERTALHLAAKCGHAKVVSVLLEFSQFVDAAAAATSKNSSLQGLLNAADRDGKTALFGAASNGRAAVVSLLLKAGAAMTVTSQGSSPLHAAASRNHAHVMQLLLSAGAAVNQAAVNPGLVPKSKMTALHIAAREGCVDAVRVLLQAGATLEAADDVGNTALATAVLYSGACRSGAAAACMELLTGAGADVNARNHNSLTPLLWTAETVLLCRPCCLPVQT
jgi:ankyrin repeat protein